MLEETYRKRINIKRFNDTVIDDIMIKDLLKKAYELVPSKQSIIPYKVEVLGPDHKKEKEEFRNFCMNKTRKNKSYDYGTRQINAPYVLLFTTRIIDDYNQVVEEKLSRGQNFKEIRNPHKITTNVLIEIGMFASILTGLCLEKKLGVSYTLCMPSIETSGWADLNYFVNAPGAIFSMSIGYSNQEKPSYPHHTFLEKKPPLKNIIKF